MRKWIARRRAALCEPRIPFEAGALALVLTISAISVARDASPWPIAIVLGVLALHFAVMAVMLVGLGPHRYLSTGCLHGEHEHCRSTVAADGSVKIPGTCKFCPAVCVCWCHPRKPGALRRLLGRMVHRRG